MRVDHFARQLGDPDWHAVLRASADQIADFATWLRMHRVEFAALLRAAL